MEAAAQQGMSAAQQKAVGEMLEAASGKMAQKVVAGLEARVKSLVQSGGNSENLRAGEQAVLCNKGHSTVGKPGRTRRSTGEQNVVFSLNWYLYHNDNKISPNTMVKLVAST